MPNEWRSLVRLHALVRAARIARAGYVVLYASGDDVWPFFLPNSKVIQHGIGWDGEQARWFRRLQDLRSLGMARMARSVLCVDTNYINWLRCQSNEGYRLATKCEYIPNYADLDRIAPSDRPLGDRLSIISARRNEHIRGLDLLIDALGLLKKGRCRLRGAHLDQQGTRCLAGASAGARLCRSAQHQQ